MEILGLSDQRRAVYDEIKGMSRERQRVDIQRPKIRVEDTQDAEGNMVQTRTGHLMSDPNGSFPIGRLNSVEVDVLDKEMSRPGFMAWYRNPSRPSVDALAVAYLNAQGQWRRICPDFIFFHSDGQGVRVSVVDPHSTHLADALHKLIGLSDFAAEYGKHFHRIESVARGTDAVLRVLDLTDPEIRKNVKAADDAQALYLNCGAEHH